MEIKLAEAHLKGLSPYSPSRFHDTPKLEREGADDYEKRTWRERAHVNADGLIVQPPMGYKNGIAEAAKFLSMKIPGKGNATYTKHFEAGIMVMEEVLVLPKVKKEEVEGEWLFLPPDGRRGGSKRVKKCFPVLRQWEVTVRFHVLDSAVISQEVFVEHLELFGSFIGVGRFRPRNNGYYGRFAVQKLKWS